jgi:hypothetical protein
MAQFPTFNLPGGTDKTFKTMQLSPAAMVFLAAFFRAPAGTGGQTGQFLGTWPGGQAAAAFNAIDKWFLYPWVNVAPVNFTAGNLCVTAGGAGSSVKTAIWANSTISNRPIGPPLFVDNTGVATTANASVTVAIGPGSLPPGLYWIGTKCTGTPPTVISGNNSSFLRSLVPARTSGATNDFEFVDTYSNNAPTFAEGATFNETRDAVPLIDLILV